MAFPLVRSRALITCERIALTREVAGIGGGYMVLDVHDVAPGIGGAVLESGREPITWDQAVALCDALSAAGDGTLPVIVHAGYPEQGPISGPFDAGSYLDSDLSGWVAE